MNDKLYGQLMAYFDGEVTSEERLRLDALIENSPESQELLRRWAQNRRIFSRLKTESEQGDVFVRQVMNRITPQQTYGAEKVGLSDLLRWLFPAFGYVLSTLLVFIIFTARQPVVSADTILLSRIPQDARGVFVRNASDISQMFATEER